MKLSHLIFLLLATTCLLAACTTKVFTVASTPANLVQHKTYRWIDCQPSKHHKRDLDFIDMELPIRAVANYALTERGWTLDNQTAAFLINYDVMVRRTLVEKSDPTYLEWYQPGYFHPLTNTWSEVSYPKDFVGWDNDLKTSTKVTFVLTIVNATSNTVEWQGWTTRKIGRDGLQPDEARRAVKGIVKKMNTVY